MNEKAEFGKLMYINVISLKDYEYAPAPKKVKKEEGQDLSKIPGVAGHDFPIFHEFPHTSFDCNAMPAHPGIYANVETGCQVRDRFISVSLSYNMDQLFTIFK